MKDRIRINHQIKSPELRVIGENGDNFGVISLSEALRQADASGLDLIEISPTANPPVAKIMDFGKYQYLENKKTKQTRPKGASGEVKSIQAKIGTGDHDLEIKAGKISEFLREGHRVKVELFLSGRAKYFDKKFLEERLGRLLRFISENYQIASPIQSGPRGPSLIIERAK